jgi:hypothetical protein
LPEFQAVESYEAVLICPENRKILQKLPRNSSCKLLRGKVPTGKAATGLGILGGCMRVWSIRYEK